MDYNHWFFGVKWTLVKMHPFSVIGCISSEVLFNQLQVSVCTSVKSDINHIYFLWLLKEQYRYNKVCTLIRNKNKGLFCNYENQLTQFFNIRVCWRWVCRKNTVLCLLHIVQKATYSFSFSSKSLVQSNIYVLSILNICSH